MERHHFKLAQGYLNIDADALYFTRSGNWQEARNAKERSKAEKTGHAFRWVMGAALVVVGGLFISLGKFKSAAGTGSTMLIIGLSGLGIYLMYNKLRHDFSPVFRIPFSKISRLAYTDSHLEIEFLNAAFKEDRLRVQMSADAGVMAATRWAESRGSV